jgi:hypothetical protein
MDLVRLDGARGSRANVGCARILAEIETGTGGALLTGWICLGKVAHWMTCTFCFGGEGGGIVGLESLVGAGWLGCLCLVSDVTGFAGVVLVIGNVTGEGVGWWDGETGIVPLLGPKSTISISSPGWLEIDWTLWDFALGITRGSEKDTFLVLFSLFRIMEPLFLFLFFLTLSTRKKIQKFKRSMIPHPVKISAKALPIVNLRFLSSLVEGLVAF